MNIFIYALNILVQLLTLSTLNSIVLDRDKGGLTALWTELENKRMKWEVQSSP